MSVKLVRDIMVKDVISISPFSTLREALSRMKAKKVKSLVVLKQDDHDAYGLVTYTNILKTIIAEEGDIDLINVYDIYIKPALTVSSSLAINHAAKIMSKYKVKRLIVTDDNQLVGILTIDDLIADTLKMID